LEDLPAKTQKVLQVAIQEIVLVKVRGMASQARLVWTVAQWTTLKAMQRVKLVKQVKQVKQVKPKVLTVLLVQMVELIARTLMVVQ